MTIVMGKDDFRPPTTEPIFIELHAGGRRPWYFDFDPATWVVWSNGQFSTVFFSFFGLLCQVHTSHCESGLDQLGLKTHRSAQGSAFWWYKHFGGQSHKNWNFGGVNMTFEPEWQKIQIHITRKLLSGSWRNFTEGTHHEWPFVGSPAAPPKRSIMAATAILIFAKMSITPDWIKTLSPCGRDRHVTKSPKVEKLKLIRVKSSNERLEHKGADLSDYNKYLNQIWYITV